MTHALRRRCAILGAGLVSVLVGALVGAWPRHHAAPARSASADHFRVEGVRTVVYRDGVRLTAAAGSVALQSARLLGPFQIGFLRTLVARDVQIEVFAEDDVAGNDAADFAADIDDWRTALSRQLGDVSGAEMHRITITRHTRDGNVEWLSARRCQTDASAGSLVCWHGTLQEGADALPFAEAHHDGHAWRIVRAGR